MIAGSFKALKSTVATSPGSVIVPDFDFETKREFATVGFASILDVWQFERVWKTQELQQGLAAGIAARETALLSSWLSAGGSQPAWNIGSEFFTIGFMRDPTHAEARTDSRF